jgi:hypothetical protein
MKRHNLMLVLLLGFVPLAFAGHGLINSFAGIEWLPEPDSTPTDLLWHLERWREARALADLDAPEPRMQMRLRLARERLAEAVAEVTRHHPRDATTALDAYAVLIVAAREDLEAVGREAPADFRQYAETLLEHRYIVATEYFDLPRDTRPVLAAAITAAAAQYSRVRARFSRREQESLFFKEEEVRWAWEQAQAADAQGL